MTKEQFADTILASTAKLPLMLAGIGLISRSLGGEGLATAMPEAIWNSSKDAERAPRD